MSAPTQYVIAPKYLPPRVPVVGLTVLYLVLERAQAPQWCYGVLLSLTILCVVAFGLAMWRVQYRCPLLVEDAPAPRARAERVH